MTTAVATAHPSKSPEPVIIRLAREDELPIIQRQWLHDYEHSPFGALFSKGEFRKSWEPVVLGLLARGATFILAPADSPDAMIYAWACVQRGNTFVRPILHYLLVRGMSRRLGYANALLDHVTQGADGVFLTHPTVEAKRLARRWLEEGALAAGRCPDCDHELTITARRTPAGTEETLVCRRRPAPGHPPCEVTLTRRSGETYRPRPKLVFNPTLV